jgi:hypothetical protein
LGFLKVPFSPIKGHHFDHNEFEPTSSWGGRKGTNHKTNFISSVVIWFAFPLFMLSNLIFLFQGLFSTHKSRFLILIFFSFRGGYMGQIAHPNVCYIPWFFKDSNCLQTEVQCNLQVIEK